MVRKLGGKLSISVIVKGTPYAWQGSFTRLFSDSPTIGQLVTFGRFDLIREYGERHQLKAKL